MTVLIAIVAVVNLALGYWLAIYLGAATTPEIVPLEAPPAPVLPLAPAPVAEEVAPTKPEAPVEKSPPADPTPEQEAPIEEAAIEEAAAPDAVEEAAAAEPAEEPSDDSDDSDDETDLLAGIESFRAELAQQKPEVQEAVENAPQAGKPPEGEEEATPPRAPGAEPVEDLDANEADTEERLDAADDEEEPSKRPDPANDEVAAGIAAFREQLAVMKNAGVGSPATVES